ncbi:cytochrome P450 [Deinococcus roseus]|uniref:Cytochrome P450 n=1 Tax=Deinococcus roseus TaxID=392414 RepID=A0ABQ2CZ04_9DEIO|nr:cytochrome P450 [Deinococcus roseus]GGJ34412.1 cytochrome P450 [Deinococcus roseus]
MTTLMNASAVPQMPGVPVLGNAPEFRKDPIQTLANGFNRYGDVVRYQIAQISIYGISNPELAQQVLVDRSKEFLKMERPGKPPVGLGLVGRNGLVTNPSTESWLIQRRMMQPTFHKARLASMGQKMADAVQEMLQRWESSTAPLDMDQEMLYVTMDIITRTMFSSDIHSSAGQAAHASGVALHFASRRIVNPLKLPLKLPLPSHLEFHRAMATLDRIIFKLIEDRQPHIGKHGDLLDMLLEARDADTGEGMSVQQLRDELVTIFVAGHETTAHSLAWTWMLLGQHPEVVQRIHAELQSVVGSRMPTAADLPALVYTTQVFQEAMRLYPAAPLIPRRIEQDTHMGSHVLQGNSRVLTCVRNIHRHPDFWENPERFDPERFGAGQEKRHRLAFMPFGAGARMCIGNNLAMMEAVLILASVLQKFDLQPLPAGKIGHEFAVTLRPKQPIFMRAQRRAEL